MNKHGCPLRVLYLIYFPVALACTVTGRLLPKMLNEPISTQSPTEESKRMETPSHTPTVTQWPTLTPMAPCVLQTGSEGLSAIQDDVDGLVTGATVVWFDDFNCGTMDPGWGIGSSNPTMQVYIVEGVVRIRANKYKDVWEGLNRTESSLRDEMGFLVLFRFENGTTGNLALVTGIWQTPSNRSWMLALKYENAQTAIWEGWEGTTWISANFPYSMLQNGVWYYLLFRLGDAGELSAMVWEKDRPDNQTEFHRNMKLGWAGRNWTALFQVYEGTIELDRYLELSFDGNE